jgi:hypothetical protein
MQKARFFIAVSCAGASAACGTEIARAVDIAPTTPAGVDAGPPGLPEKPPVCMAAKITDRLLYGKITLPDAVRYKRSAYYFGFPQDDRIAFSVANNGVGQVAWISNGGTLVHVTQIAPAEFARTADDVRVGDDTIIDGYDVGGLVALDDGFALLTRRPDLGEPIQESTGQATFLVRWSNDLRSERFSVPLTGTAFKTNSTDPADKRDFPLAVSPISLSGRLVSDGSHFGAYFGVRGGTGDRFQNQSSDKFVIVDDAGQFVSGFRGACRQNLGSRLLFDTSGFVPFCMSDGESGTAGAYVVSPTRAIRIAPEITFSSGGYAGGNFGSAVKLTNGYMLVWASRGVKVQSGQIIGPGRDFHAPAVVMVKKDLTIGYERMWPFIPKDDPNFVLSEDAVNVHAQAYGSDKVLVVWETIASPAYQPNAGLSMGNYGGTHFQLIDANGNIASAEEIVPNSIAPNGPDDIVLFPNGDLGWAYVPEDRYFQNFTAPNGVSALTEIRFVRLPYCTPPTPP